VDGHDTDEIYKSYIELQNINKPKAIICNTIKGKGVSFMENQPIWAYRSPSPTEFRVAINELDA
jgi:transketolase